MRTLWILALVAVGSAAEAAPCITATASDAGEANVLRQALVAEFPATPHVCIDASLVSIDQDDSPAEIALSATVRVVISDDRGQIKSVLSGGAIVHIARADYRARRTPMYRRDALEQAITGMLPALRAQLAPTTRRPTS
jgi:hypothetical protein